MITGMIIGSVLTLVVVRFQSHFSKAAKVVERRIDKALEESEKK